MFVNENICMKKRTKFLWKFQKSFLKTIFSKAKRRGKLKRKRDITIKRFNSFVFVLQVCVIRL